MKKLGLLLACLVFALPVRAEHDYFQELMEGRHYWDGSDGHPKDRERALAIFKALKDKGYRYGEVDYAVLLHEGSEDEQAEAEEILDELLKKPERPEELNHDSGARERAIAFYEKWHPENKDEIKALRMRPPPAPAPAAKATPIAKAPPPAIASSLTARGRRWPDGTQLTAGEYQKDYQLLAYDPGNREYVLASRFRRETGPGYWVNELRLREGAALLDRLRPVPRPLLFCSTCGGSGIVNYAIRHGSTDGRLDPGKRINLVQGRFDERCGACNASGVR